MAIVLEVVATEVVVITVVIAVIVLVSQIGSSISQGSGHWPLSSWRSPVKLHTFCNLLKSLQLGALNSANRLFSCNRATEYQSSSEDSSISLPLRGIYRRRRHIFIIRYILLDSPDELPVIQGY